MRFVGKLSLAYAKAELLSALPVQQQDQSRAILSPPSQSTAAEQAQVGLALSPDPSVSPHAARR